MDVFVEAFDVCIAKADFAKKAFGKCTAAADTATTASDARIAEAAYCDQHGKHTCVCLQVWQMTQAVSVRARVL